MARADDQGHKEADKVLNDLTKKIKKEYSKAVKNAEKKIRDHYAQFEAEDKEMRKQLSKGEISKREYNGWRNMQLATGKHWKDIRDTLAKDLSDSDKIARKMIYDSQPEVYAENHNYETYQIEHDSHIDTEYTLYDRATVKKLMTEDKDLLPQPSTKKQKEIDAKNTKRNRQKVTSAVTQSILLGESIPDMAKRVAKATGENNMKVAIRNARTMVTGAENAGRQDSMERAEKMGIEIKKEWIATLDGHTRDSHIEADGMVVGLHDTFSLMHGDLEYPGDPSGPPSEVYNCRCTMISVVEGVDPRLTEENRMSKLRSMSYEDWKNEHRK